MTTPVPARTRPGRRLARTTRNDDQWPRYLTITAAGWLFVSAFAWPHAHTLATNTWVTAVLMFSVAFAAVQVPSLRYWNTALSVWLLFSTIAMRSINVATMWNNFIVAAVVFVLSLVRSSTGTRTAHP